MTCRGHRRRHRPAPTIDLGGGDIEIAELTADPDDAVEGDPECRRPFPDDPFGADDLARITAGPRPHLAPGRQRPGQLGSAAPSYGADFGRPVRAYIGISNALSVGGVCTECHLPTRGPTGQANLMPVNFPDRFLTSGYFSHAAHTKQKCTDCHAAETSKLASDLLMPDLKSCRTCHLGAAAVKTAKIVPSDCAMCHAYHVPSGQWQGLKPAKPSAPHYKPPPEPAKNSTVAAKLAQVTP